MNSMSLSAPLQSRTKLRAINNQVGVVRAHSVDPSSPVNLKRIYSKINHRLSRHRLRLPIKVASQSSNCMDFHHPRASLISLLEAWPNPPPTKTARANKLAQGSRPDKYQSRIGRNGSRPHQVQIQTINDFVNVKVFMNYNWFMLFSITLIS